MMFTSEPAGDNYWRRRAENLEQEIAELRRAFAAYEDRRDQLRREVERLEAERARPGTGRWSPR